MTNEQVIGLFGTCRDLVELEERRLATMKKLIFAYAHEHLKQNKVTQTTDDWQFTRAALDMLMGKKQFTPNVGGFYSRRSWPTHLRISDLKPVRVRSTREGWYTIREMPYRRPTSSHFVDEIVNQEGLDTKFLPLTDKEIE